MQDREKICFFIGSMDRGGAERVISILANYYVRKGYGVRIVMLLSNKCGYNLDPRIELVNLSGKNISRVRRITYWLNDIHSYLAQFNPDYIVAFAARIGLLVTIAGYKWKDKIIISERSDPRYDNRGFLGKILVPIIYPKVKGIVFQTQRAKHLFPQNIQDKSNIVINPVVVQCKAVDFKDREKKIVSVGRLIKLKNHAMLIQSFANIAMTYPDYKLYIYGEGEMRPKLEKQISRLGLGNKVFLPGNIKNINEAIADASIFVLSSDFEGLSNALLEAMMMGLPCISTNCGGADEVIKDGKNGLLINVGDGFALEKELLRLLADNDLRENIGVNAQITSEQFKPSIVLKQWARVIEQ